MKYTTVLWARRAPVRGVEAHVLLALATYAEDGVTVRQSQRTLVAATGWSERMIRKALNGLIAAGLIRRKRDTRLEGRALYDQYELLVSTDVGETLPAHGAGSQLSPPARGAATTGTWYGRRRKRG